MTSQKKKYKEYINGRYKYGFKGKIVCLKPKKGLDMEVIEYISKKKAEPRWMLRKRLISYSIWLEMRQPKWVDIKYKRKILRDIYYYSEPKAYEEITNLNDIDINIIKTYKKLGIPIFEQKILSGVAVDAIFDSVSVAVTYKKELEKYGIIFSSISTAVVNYPGIIKLYLNSVISNKDNFYAALNSTVYSDGTFIYIPKNIRCPIELSSYFRINTRDIGQFERTLIVADKNSYVSYLEGCTAIKRNKSLLHAAVVELIAFENAYIKYSTVQNWYPGNSYGKGGVYNFVTKRGLCEGENSIISWIQIEVGAAITWKYPSCILKGNNSVGKFSSVALTKNYQQADTGTKMIHIGKGSRSIIISKSIAAGKSRNIFRSLVKFSKNSVTSKNYTQCDSLIIGKESGVATIPNIENNNNCSKIEHEASITKINRNQLDYCYARGISIENAISLIVSGFCKNIFKKLPLEFFMEARVLLYMNLEGTIG